MSIGLFDSRYQTHTKLVAVIASVILTLLSQSSCTRSAHDSAQSDTQGTGRVNAETHPGSEKKSSSVIKKWTTSIRKAVNGRPCLTLAVPQALATLAHESPAEWPTKAIAPQPILNQKQILAKLSNEEQQALTVYTYAGFEQVRLYENSTPAELKAKSWSAYEIHAASLFSQAIDRALRKLPVTEGVLYRGIHGISPEDVAIFVWHWQEKVPLGLGPKNKPAVTSASWDPHIAKNFVFHKWKPNQDDTYGILFEIRAGHRGVGIEQIAVHTVQREVLLLKDSRFTIERIAAIQGESKVLKIVLRPLIP